jgi:hypothetical protein
MISGGDMAKKLSGSERAFRREREWPILMQVARQEKLDPYQTRLLLAVRQQENGPPGFEFGEIDVKGTDLKTQATSFAKKMKKTWENYNQLLQNRYWKLEGGRRAIGLGLESDITLPNKQELEFRKWYLQEATKRRLNLNPDDPRHKYAYRAYWKSVKEGRSYPAGEHFPSEFKLVGHSGPEYVAVSPKIDFPEFLAYYGSYGYGRTPIHAPELTTKEVALNKTWAPNVRRMETLLKRYFESKGEKT